MEGVLSEMISNEDMTGRYYNWKDEQDKINRSIIAEERDDAKKEGILETKKEMVINMYKDNVKIETIAKYSNLSIQEVEKIIKETDINNL